MAKKRKDQLGVAGFASALLRNIAQQRSLAKVRKAKSEPAPPPKPAAPKVTRTPAQLRADVDATRADLLETVENIKYDLDVAARARDLRDRIAADIPSRLKGRTPAMAVAGSILLAGLGSIGAAVVARVRR